MNKSQRSALKEMFGGNCAYCGCVLGEKWHADHVESIGRLCDYESVRMPNGAYRLKAIYTGKMLRPQNDHKDNLMPACVPCNIHKSTYNIEGFRKMLGRHIDSMNKNSNFSMYRHAKRFGLVQETGNPITFYFESYIDEANVSE